MQTNGSPTKPYAEGAPQYRQAGWLGTLPLPPNRKSPPPDGYTGAEGRYPTDETAEAWAQRCPGHNIGLRLPEGVVGYDADLYKEEGRATHEALLERCGPLPATWTSTSRTDGSGIRFYRIPKGHKLRGALGGVEIVQHHHRYAVMAPSIHPEGRPYLLISPDGEIVDSLPPAIELPRLPKAWLEALAEPEPGSAESRPVSTTTTWSPKVRAAYGNGLAALGDGSRHDSELPVVMTLARYEERGHPGATEALDALGLAFAHAVADRCSPAEAEAEWERMVSGARAKVAASPPTTPPYDPDSDDGPPRRNLTDIGNSMRLVERHASELRHCSALGWLAWDGRRWSRGAAKAALRAGKATALSIYTEAATEADPDKRKGIAKWAHQSESVSRVKAMVDLATAEIELDVAHDDLDADPWALNCLNGTLDLRSGTLRPHRQGDLLTKLAPVEWRPGARSEEWERFLERVLPDPAVRAYTQRLLGAGATGKPLEGLPIFYGSGANGKSTLLESVRRVLGDHALATNPDLLLVTKHQEHATELARLAGARLITTVEVGQHRRLNEALVKQLTGGDRMTGRFMRQDYFEFDPSWVIVMATNHKPVIHGADDGIWRRVSLVPFTVTIPEAERDATLRDRLPVEAGPAILQWLVEGCLEWQRSGMAPPPAVRAATKAYRGESDTIGRFLAERCEVGEGLSELFANLHGAYEIWAADSGLDSLTKTALGTLLNDRGHASFRSTCAPWRNKTVRLGLRLAPLDPLQSLTESEFTSTESDLLPVAPGFPETHTRTHTEKYPETQEQPGAILEPSQAAIPKAASEPLSVEAVRAAFDVVIEGDEKPKPGPEPPSGPYRWVACDTCGEWALLARTRRCYLTSGCKGSHRLSSAPLRTRRLAP